MARKFELLHSSIIFTWNHLRVKTNNFNDLLSNEDWKIAQDGLFKLIEVLAKTIDESPMGSTHFPLYEHEWQEWAISQFDQLSTKLSQHDGLTANDERASNSLELKELLALEMSFYWRLIAFLK